jgi:biopolymer transport protein ExbD
MIEFEYGKDLTGREPGPDLTPMVDMIFQLLIFFLLTSFLILPAVNVALPRSRSPEATPPSALTLTVHRDGSLLLAGEVVCVEDLPSLLSAALAGRTEPTLIIQADRSVAFGRMIEVMEAAHAGGASDISFLVERAESGPAGGPSEGP